MWRTKLKTVNNGDRSGLNFVLGGDEKKSFQNFLRVIHTRKILKIKNALLNKVRKVFHISTELIVLTSIYI
jgi:hypothetical protein